MTPQERKNFEWIRDNVHGEMTQVEAMKLAIEWIEAQPEPRMIGASKAITALRQALEQSTEPVAWLCKRKDGHFDVLSDQTCTKCFPVYTQPQEHLERLCRIMGTFDLATGHAETMDDALDSLESELRDVLGHYREAFKNINTQCQNCASLEAQNTELDAKLAELERKEFAVHAVDIARRAVAEERSACVELIPPQYHELRDRIRARGKDRA